MVPIGSLVLTLCSVWRANDMPASTCQVRAQLTVTLVPYRPEYRGRLKGAKQDDVQSNVGTSGRRGVSEPLKRPDGQQPVVAKKWGNAHRAKGQSQSKETALHFQSKANEKQLTHGVNSLTRKERNYEGSQTESANGSTTPANPGSDV